MFVFVAFVEEREREERERLKHEETWKGEAKDTREVRGKTGKVE